MFIFLKNPYLRSAKIEKKNRWCRRNGGEDAFPADQGQRQDGDLSFRI
jgi:hypothetical protein